MKAFRRNVAFLLVLVLGAFACLGGYLLYAVAVYGGRWFATPYNTRLRDARGEVVPGDIYDARGVLLATTDANGARSYPVDKTALRALGQVLGDDSGQIPTGAQSTFAAYLLGFKANLLDRAAQWFSGERRGGDIALTIDAALQTQIHGWFPEGASGAVAVFNYKTGACVALYSAPTVSLTDLSQPAEGALLNRATQGQYAPGSVFKLVTLACALENLPDVQSRTFTCEGSYTLPDGTLLTDTDGEGHGTLGFEEAFTQSCNIAYGQLALELGAERLRTTAEAMGFNGNFLFSDLIAYNSRFPTEIASDFELAWTGVGQGRLLANPLHMALLAGAVANGGAMVEPQLLLSTMDARGGTKNALHTRTALRPFSPAVASTLKEYMLETVRGGTGTRAAVQGLQIGGKTGTAQVNSSGGRYEPHSWFIGFCADDECPFALAVLVENGGSGGDQAARLAHKVFQALAEANAYKSNE